MDAINFIFKSINYGATTTLWMANKIVTTPSATKKLLQFSSQLVAAFNLYHNQTYLPELARSMSGAVELINIYSGIKFIIYWVHPFGKDSIDQETLKTTLKTALVAHQHFSAEDTEEEQDDFVQPILDEVMREKAFHSRKEVEEALRASLEHHEVNDSLDEIIEDVVIQQEPRSVIQLVTMACFTIACLGGNVLTLGKWGVLNLSKVAVLANQVGTKAPVLLFIANSGAGKILGTFACVGFGLSFGEATYRAINSYREGHNGHASEEDVAQASKELRAAVLDMISFGADFAGGLIPLLVNLSPRAVIALALTAKGIGVVCFLIR